MMNAVYWMLIVLLQINAVFGSVNLDEDQSVDNLWPSESTFNSVEDLSSNKIVKEISWVYELLASHNQVQKKALLDHLLYGSNNDKGVDWVVALDVDNKDSDRVALLLQTSKSADLSCGINVGKDEEAKFVILPKDLTSNRRIGEVRCFKVKKCSRSIPSMATDSAFTESPKVYIYCIDNFEAQLSLSKEKDLAIVSDRLESWTSKAKVQEKGTDNILLSSSDLRATKISENTRQNIQPVNGGSSVQNMNLISVASEAKTDNEFNSTTDSNKRRASEESVLNLKEDLNLFNEEEIKLKMNKESKDPKYSDVNLVNSLGDSFEDKGQVPSSRMLDDNWDRNKVNARALENTDSLKNENIRKLDDDSIKVNPTSDQTFLKKVAQEKSTHDENYVKELETSYEKKFTLMNALYVTTIVLLIGFVLILVWYCNRRISRQGTQYRSGTLTRGEFEEDLSDSKKYERANGKDGSISTPLSIREGSISTIGQVSSGSLRRKYRW